MLYSVIKFLLGNFIRLVFRLKVTGSENIPLQGGAIVAANHISLWDPPVVGAALARRVSFMAKEELFNQPLLGWTILRLGAFPVRRNTADRNAIRTALGRLADGHLVGLFPEGTRSKTGELGSPEPGIALIAAKAGVPIIPAAVIGTDQVLCNGTLLPQFEVRFGPPLYLVPGKTDKETLDDISNNIMHQIGQLLRNNQSSR
ncbi:MAG TPA: lysophospholipid acyltransferase family protein [Patescibacteria group bacterium]|nr:lysophospholipid acyltransferase family protein [Patescibacteria group bacterium]